MQNISINRIKSFADAFDGTCDDRRADKHYRDKAQETEEDIRKDYKSQALKVLRKLSGTAKKLSGEARKQAWEIFWADKKSFIKRGILEPDSAPITDEQRVKWVKLGLHIRSRLHIARKHAHYLLTKGFAERCIIAKDPKSGQFGIFTKNPPRNEDHIIEVIDQADNAEQLAKITTAPYRHGDKIQKTYNVTGYIDKWVAGSYFEIQVRAFTEWGAELIVKEAAPNVTILEATEKATDWENDDFPADDTVVSSDNFDDEEWTNSVADLTNPWTTAEETHDANVSRIESSIAQCRGQYEEEDA